MVYRCSALSSRFVQARSTPCGVMGLYECPDGCHETAGNAPYCANDSGGGTVRKTNGYKGGPCRVRNPDAPPEYRCDDGGVCIMAVGTPKSQFKGEGVYYDVILFFQPLLQNLQRNS
eukprot:scaffold13140_cov164-Skeletonema_menzelii.AAC.1